MASTTPTVLQLGSLIASSLATLSEVCEKNSIRLPEPADPVFREESEAFRANQEAADAANIIVASALQLVAALLPPKQSIFHIVSGSLKTAALRTAIGCHVPEILREAGSQGLHVNDIASKTDVDGTKLGRLLRMLANHHIFRETSPDVFANTRLSSVLDTGNEVSAVLQDPNSKHDKTSGFVALVEHSITPTPLANAFMLEALRDPEYAHSEEPTSGPFHYAYKAFNAPPKTPMWKWLELPGNEYALKRFGLAMRGIGGMQPKDSILEAYPWGSLPPSSVIVDVGAGIGTSAMLVARAFPHLKFVVQDREKVVEEARAHWEGNYPEAVKEGRVEFQAADFFAPQPPLPSAIAESSTKPSVFILKNILHNWSNKYAKNVLSQLRGAAGDNSQLLVIGTIMANLSRGDAGGDDAEEIGARFKEAPEPLLPNYGAANEMGYTIDITMLTYHNAQERTLGQMRSLLASSGWKLKQVKRSNPPNNFFDPVIAVPI